LIDWAGRIPEIKASPDRIAALSTISPHAHADRHEKEAEQEPAERLNVRGDLMAVMGLGQQHPGEEGTEGHGQARHLGHEPAGQYHDQRQRDEDVGIAHGRHLLEDVAQHDAPDAEDRHHRHDGLEHGLSHRQAEHLAVPTEGQREHQERPHHHVLDQQDCEARPPEPAGQLAAVDQHSQHDGGRGERQGAADHHAGSRRYADEDGDAGHRQRGDEDLSGAEGEDAGLHHPDPFERQFQPDREQQEDDPQLAQGLDRVDIGHQGEAARPDHRAGHQVSQHRAPPKSGAMFVLLAAPHARFPCTAPVRSLPVPSRY
jgi:hypothetical protein